MRWAFVENASRLCVGCPTEIEAANNGANDLYRTHHRALLLGSGLFPLGGNAFASPEKAAREPTINHTVTNTHSQHFLSESAHCYVPHTP